MIRTLVVDFGVFFTTKRLQEVQKLPNGLAPPVWRYQGSFGWAISESTQSSNVTSLQAAAVIAVRNVHSWLSIDNFTKTKTIPSSPTNSFILLLLFIYLCHCSSLLPPSVRNIVVYKAGNARQGVRTITTRSNTSNIHSILYGFDTSHVTSSSRETFSQANTNFCLILATSAQPSYEGISALSLLTALQKKRVWVERRGEMDAAFHLFNEKWSLSRPFYHIHAYMLLNQCRACFNPSKKIRETISNKTGVPDGF